MGVSASLIGKRIEDAKGRLIEANAEPGCCRGFCFDQREASAEKRFDIRFLTGLGFQSHQQRNRYHRSSPLMLSASKTAGASDYEQVAATIFSDLTVNVGVRSE